MADPTQVTQPAPLLEVKALKTFFHTEDGLVKAVNGTSLEVYRGEVLGLVGESGSGKSVTGLSILGLVDRPGEIVGGEIWFDGQSLLDLPKRELVNLRGSHISMIFQQPISSINPVLTLGSQVAEILRLHQQMGNDEAWQRAIELLKLVGIPDPEKRARAYPHQISGGQAQRIMIAMALALNPALLIADEPTTALDVTIQAQILDLMQSLSDKLGTAIILITHDMGVIAENAERVVVMYAGKKVEEGDADELFSRPCHPYTEGLLGSIPRLDLIASGKTNRARLNEIEGVVPSLYNLPKGCTFADRCDYATDQCHAAFPPLEEKRPGHWAACWHSDRVLGTEA